MKLNGQSRSFARQVQVDLLALCDADLMQTINHWVQESDPSQSSPAALDDVRIALGYTRVGVESAAHSQLAGAAPASWRAPSPHSLRALLTSMDVHVFAQYVITSAFQALHPIYPEWYEGVTFNAHLANHLRRMGNEAARQKQRP
jgi:hypothetical protein